MSYTRRSEQAFLPQQRWRRVTPGSGRAASAVPWQLPVTAPRRSPPPAVLPGSDKPHKGRYSAPACGLCPSAPVHVTLCWLRSFVVQLGNASPSWQPRFVLQVRGPDTVSGEHIRGSHAQAVPALEPSSPRRADVPSCRSSDGGMGSAVHGREQKLVFKKAVPGIK